MTNCECLPGCPFFNDRMPMEGGLGAMYKKSYCQGDNSKCARYMVFSKKGRGAVPPTLYPNQHDVARALIA